MYHFGTVLLITWEIKPDTKIIFGSADTTEGRIVCVRGGWLLLKFENQIYPQIYPLYFLFF